MQNAAASTEKHGDAFAQSVAAVRTRFLATLDERGAELDVLMELADAGEDPNACFKRAAGIVHKISGVAQTLGFPELGQLAATAEQLMTAAVAPGASKSDFATATRSVDDVVLAIEAAIA